MPEEMNLTKAKRWAEIQQEADKLLRTIEGEYREQIREYKGTHEGLTRAKVESLVEASTALGMVRNAFGRLYSLYMNNSTVIYTAEIDD